MSTINQANPGSTQQERRRNPERQGTLPPTLNAELNFELLDLATAELPDDQLRERLRSLAIRLTGGMGAARTTQNSSGQWRIPAQEQTGRIPASETLDDWLAKRCSEAVLRGNITIDHPEFMSDVTTVIIPLLQFGCPPECLLLLLPKASDIRPAMIILQRIASVLRICLKGQLASQSTWKLSSLAALVELVSCVESSADPHAARLRIANEMAAHLNCPFVAVGSVQDQAIDGLDISGARTIDSRSQTYHDFRQALEEALLREQPALWPAPSDNNHLLLAHRQLAAGLQCEAVLSQPLVTVDGKLVGCWLFAGPAELVHADRMQRFVATAAPRIAGAIEVIRRTRHPWVIRRIAALSAWAKTRQAVVMAAVTLSLGILLATPMPCRVRGMCTISPSEKRFAVAPYNGMIARGFVRPGDHVRAGDLLAEMDGRSLSIELSGVAANYLKAVRKQDIELADHNISNLQLAALEAEGLKAEESLLRLRHQNLQILSPIDGVVLSGSTERAESATVRQGQILFEVGSLRQQRIELEIPNTEIACVAVGQRALVWVEGLENHTIEGVIERIHGQAELRNGKLVFVAEVTFTADPAWPLYPGMRGSARIDGNRNPLAWNLFRRPYEVLCSYLAW